jgi:nucleoside-diphosphate-sugar epimerase
MRVLVLGATGYVGRHIVSELGEHSWAEPIAASRRGSARRLDATQAAGLARAFGEVDAVINTIDGSPGTIVSNARALQSALARHPHVRLIYFSSMAAYGSAQGIIDEHAELRGDIGSYSAAKARAEQGLAATLAQTVILRPGCIYGRGSPQWTTRIARLLRAHRIGEMGALGDNATNLVHIDDVVHAVLAALQSPSSCGQAYNLADPQGPTWNEYFSVFGRLLGATPISRVSPRRIAMETKLAAPALKAAERVFGALGLPPQRLPAMITPSLAHLWEQDIRLSSDKATHHFSLRWTPWRDALREETAHLG